MFKSEVHSHDTEDNIYIHTYQIKHDFAKKCLGHNLHLLVNNIPEIIKEKLISQSTQGSIKYVKLYFLYNYQVTCTRQNCYV